MSKERVDIGVAGSGRIGKHLLWQTEKESPLGGNYVFWKPTGFNGDLDNTHINVNALVSRGDPEQLAYLLDQDSKYPGLKLLRSADCQHGCLVIDGRKIAYEQYDFSQQKEQFLKWDQQNAKIVVESTGITKTKQDAEPHLRNGASLVILSCPAKDDTPTFVYGVNHQLFSGKEKVISNASCTTNCAAPVVNLFKTEFGLDWARIRTIHTYTGSQRIIDGSSKKGYTRGRSAVRGGIIPTTTGLSKALKLVVPGLEQVPVESDALRINSDTTSMVEIVMSSSSPITEESVVDRLRYWSQPGGPLFGVMALADSQEVSSDFNGCSFASIVSLGSIKVIDGKILTLDAYYDNEAGFTHNLTNLVNHVSKKLDL